jgi:hypothetical protein
MEAMPDDSPRPTGLKPTLRHLAILVVWAAIIFAAARFLIRLGGFNAPPPIACMTVSLLGGAYPMPVLAILVGVLDRRGPVRSWYIACILAGASFLGSALLILQDPVCFAICGRPTLICPLSTALGVLCLWASWRQWRLVRPAACSICGHRCVISVVRPLGPGSRRRFNGGTSGWCAACGARYERKDVRAEWRLAESEDEANQAGGSRSDRVAG